MERVEQPERIAIAPGGDVAAFIVSAQGGTSSAATGVWLGPLDGSPLRVSEQEPTTPLAFSPDGSRFAFAVQQEEQSNIEIWSTATASHTTTISMPGFAEGLRWSASGLLALVAEPGADSASLHSGRPLAGGGGDPRVLAGATGWRRVWRLDPEGAGAPAAITPAGPTVWEFCALADGGLVALCSDDPSEDGWYHTYLTHFGRDGASMRTLHRSDWLLSSPSVDPSGEQLAFIEGWASDRGLLAGEIRHLELSENVPEPRALDPGIDVTWVSWDASGRLWFAGWDHLGTAWGWYEVGELDGSPTVQRASASCVNARWHPEVVPIGGDTVLTSLSTSDARPEVARFTIGREPQRWSGLNIGTEPRPFTLHELKWMGVGELEIEGLLALPVSTGGGAPPLVTDIHGGPSAAWHHTWTLTWAEVLTAAGFAVLMPNYRGSVGRGQSFGRANLGDAAGAELEDVVAGVRHCAAQGLIDERRVGAIGGSYGGYLTAWATCRPEVFRAGVVVAGVTDLLSCRGTANNASFYDHLLQGTPREKGTDYLRRSPIIAIDDQTAPTLILHGEQDRCVPVGQAHELHHALTSAGVDTELVIYPREGHQSLEQAHIDDQHRRATEWLRRYLS